MKSNITKMHGQQHIKKWNVCFDFLYKFCAKHFSF